MERKRQELPGSSGFPAAADDAHEEAAAAGGAGDDDDAAGDDGDDGAAAAAAAAVEVDAAVGAAKTGSTADGERGEGSSALLLAALGPILLGSTGAGPRPKERTTVATGSTCVRICVSTAPSSGSSSGAELPARAAGRAPSSRASLCSVSTLRSSRRSRPAGSASPGGARERRHAPSAARSSRSTSATSAAYRRRSSASFWRARASASSWVGVGVGVSASERSGGRRWPRVLLGSMRGRLEGEAEGLGGRRSSVLEGLATLLPLLLESRAMALLAAMLADREVAFGAAWRL